MLVRCYTPESQDVLAAAFSGLGEARAEGSLVLPERDAFRNGASAMSVRLTFNEHVKLPCGRGLPALTGQVS